MSIPTDPIIYVNLMYLNGNHTTKDWIICKVCGDKIHGDPKYHQVYENGLLVGYRHRKCVPC